MNGPETIIFANQKGGVGKSTIKPGDRDISLSSKGLRVLLVDTDPQGNLTRGLVDEDKAGLYEALATGEIFLTEIDTTLSLLCGDYRLAGLEKSLIGEIDGYHKLKELFKKPVFKSFDYILIDSPPSLGYMSVNGLAAARYLLVPMNPSLYSFQGTNDLFKTVSKVKNSFNPELKLSGVIINSYDRIPVITRQIKQEIREVFGDKVFSAMLSRSIKLEESIAAKTGVIFHKSHDKSRAKAEVCALGDELLSRLEGVEGKETPHGEAPGNRGVSLYYYHPLSCRRNSQPFLYRQIEET